ncbi:MAG: YecA family protein [Nitrospiria bacterium]
MTKIGRNESCPCGSGKKYKKCCIEKSRFQKSKEQDLIGTFTHKDRSAAIKKLLDYSSRPEFEEDREIALMIYWGDRLEDKTDEEIQGIGEMEQTMINFNTWFLYDMDIEEGKTITDFFLSEGGPYLSVGERAYMEKARQSSFRLYEVKKVERDKGFLLEDLWDGKTYSVSERSGTHHFVQWDLMATRLMDVGDQHFEIDGSMFSYPSRVKSFLLKALRKENKRYHQIEPGSKNDTGFFKRFGILFNHWWLDIVAFPQMPRVYTSERDEFVLTRVIFDQKDPDRLIAAIKACNEFKAANDGKYSWYEKPPENLNFLGSLIFRKNRLIVETNSKERGEKGRLLLEKIAGNAIKYRITEYQDMKQALKSKPKRERPASSSLPPEVEAQAVKAFLDQHYQKWLDDKIPALSNKTPRHAVTLKTFRPKVIDVLKSMENNEAHAANHGKIPYDFSWLWKELGLEREKE